VNVGLTHHGCPQHPEELRIGCPGSEGVPKIRESEDRLGLLLDRRLSLQLKNRARARVWACPLL